MPNKKEEPPTEINQPHGRVLLAINDPLVTEWVSQLTKEANYSVSSVHTLSEAWHSIARNPPDLLAVSLRIYTGTHPMYHQRWFPNAAENQLMRATDFIAQVRAQWPSSPMPIIIIGAYVDEKVLNFIRESGANGYICMPFSAGDVAAVWDAALRGEEYATNISPENSSKEE